MENEEFYLILYETSWLSAFVAICLFEKTKPIYRPLAGNPKHETQNPKQVERVYLKKQTQFALGGNELKYLYEM